MKDRTKLALVILICATVFVIAGCATTPEPTAVNTETAVIRETREDGVVVLRVVAADDTILARQAVQFLEVDESRLPDQPLQSDIPQNRSTSWQCRLARVLHAGAMIAAYPELAAVYVGAVVNDAMR